MTSPGLMQCVWLRVEQSGGLACKAGLGVDGLDWGLWRYAVCVALQDALDGAVSRAVMRQGALAGVFQARRAIGLGQADDALSCAQALQDVIAQQAFDDLLAVRSNRLGLFIEPLAVARQERLGLWRQMIRRGHALALALGTGVRGHQAKVLVQGHAVVGGAQPQGDLVP